MLGAILRRAGLGVGCNSDEFAAESTLFSLSTAIPRPTEKRTETRLLTLLPLAKLVTENAQILCRIKNISTGGLMAEAVGEHPVGTRIYIEIGSNQRIPGEVAWTRNTNIGVKFDQNVDLRELLANRRPRNGYRAASAAARGDLRRDRARRRLFPSDQGPRHLARRDAGRDQRLAMHRQEGGGRRSKACARSRAGCAGTRMAMPGSCSIARSASTSLPNGWAKGSRSRR